MAELEPSLRHIDVNPIIFFVPINVPLSFSVLRLHKHRGLFDVENQLKGNIYRVPTAQGKLGR